MSEEELLLLRRRTMLLGMWLQDMAAGQSTIMLLLRMAMT